MSICTTCSIEIEATACVHQLALEKSTARMSRVGNASRQSTSVLDEELETQIGSRNIRATEADPYQVRDKYFDSQRESETMPETAEVPEPDVEKPPKKLLFSARPGDEGGKPRPKKEKWSMGLIAMGVVAGLGSVGAGVYAIRPQDPIFEVELITLSGFNLRFCTDSPLLLAIVDVSLTLHIKVINPNVTPIVFSSTIMDIYYRGNLLGQAKVSLLFLKHLKLPVRVSLVPCSGRGGGPLL